MSKSVKWCGIALAGGAGAVEIVRRADGTAAALGTTHCGSPWACPVCAARCRAERAAEVTAAVEAHGIERTEMLTLTVRHAKGHDLRSMRRAVAKAWRWVQAHRDWREWAEAGTIRALEVTYGGYAGWHPHLHVLLFVPHELDERERLKLAVDLHVLWYRAIERIMGAEHVPGDNGTDVRPARRGDYLCKLGLEGLGAELTDAGLGKQGKRGGHMTPWQIAQRAGEGKVGYQRLWRDYCAGMQGAKQLTWSRGLKKRLVGRIEPEADEPVELIARIEHRRWLACARCGADLDILEAVEAGGGRETVCRIVDRAVDRAGNGPAG